MKKYQRYSLEKLYKSPKTVFTIKDFALIWESNQPELIWSRVSDYRKKGKLYRIRKGIYTKDKNYNKFELATKIYTPSYISLETILAKNDIIFQYYKTILVVSYLSREIKVDGKNIKISKIKDDILTNQKGMIKKDNYFEATKERAFLDALYLYKDYHFDNLEQLNRKKVMDLAKIYNNKALIKRTKSYFNA